MKYFSCLLGFLLSILLSACGGGGGGGTTPPPAGPVISLLQQIPAPVGDIVFDDANAYVSGAGTLWRTERSIQSGSTLTPLSPGPCSVAAVPALGTRVHQLLTQDGALYVYNAVTLEAQGEPTEHSICISQDRGQTFVAADLGLKSCIGSFCRFLAGNQLRVSGNSLYTNAGGGLNLLLSTDQGQHWTAILGSVDDNPCYHQAFEILGIRLLTGGECPLDNAYLRAYRMQTASVANPASPVAVPADLGNRMVQFIKSTNGGEIVFAGVEGGLLRSSDFGGTFQFAIKFDQTSATTYPYIRHLAVASGQPGVMLASGFGKGNGMPYLAWSSDYGVNWKDISDKLPRYSEASAGLTSEVTAVVEDPAGRLLVAVSLNKGAINYVATVSATGW